jgi:uncharacterized protein (DUF111 family)
MSRRLLHLDAFSGAAGNMFMGAMLDLGLSRARLLEGLAPLKLDFKLVVRKVQRGGLAARHVDVVVPETKRHPESRRSSIAARPPRTKRSSTAELSRAGAAPRSAAHSHGHDHPHAPDHAHLHPHAHPHASAHGRRYSEIHRLLERARLAPAVRTRALAIFEALGRAEARVHGIALEAVHFHEVGAVDAIVDVTAAAIALDVLGIDRVTCSPVALGHGHVDSAHGRLPLPAPATLELLAGIPTVPAHVAGRR